MTRIIAGVAGGRRIAVPKKGTRPTSDRVREALFGALAHDPGIEGAAVLDLCAGSGALGLEALSRGAAHALFVESDRRAAEVLRRNVATVGLPGAEVLAVDAGALMHSRARRTYDIVLIDPPYGLPASTVVGWLTDAEFHGWLTAGAVVAIERAARDGAFPWPEPLRSVRDRRYGDTVVHLGSR